MRKSRFSEEQILMALRQAEAGTPVEEICRKLEVSSATSFRWKRRFGGMGVSELRELRQRRDENRKLKQLVADLSLDKTILREAILERAAAPTHPGDRRGPRQRRVSADPRLPQTRGMVGESQAHLPALPRRWIEPAASTTAAPSERGSPPSAGVASPTQRTVGDGLHARRGRDWDDVRG
jgi:putative transposase